MELAKNLRPSLFFFSSLITPHSIFVTHHLKYPNFLYPPVWHKFSTCHHSIFSTFCGTIPKHHVRHSCQPTRLTPFHHFISLTIHFLFPSAPNTLPKPETSTQAFLYLFIYFLQPLIPVTTTSVLSLKHKPKKLISILEAPRKFTNPQQPICCPNR